MATEERDMWYIDPHDTHVHPVRAQRQSRDTWLIYFQGEKLELELGVNLYENPIVAHQQAIGRVHRWLRSFVERQTDTLNHLTNGLLSATVKTVKERMQDDTTGPV